MRNVLDSRRCHPQESRRRAFAAKPSQVSTGTEQGGENRKKTELSREEGGSSFLPRQDSYIDCEINSEAREVSHSSPKYSFPINLEGWASFTGFWLWQMRRKGKSRGHEPGTGVIILIRPARKNRSKMSVDIRPQIKRNMCLLSRNSDL